MNITSLGQMLFWYREAHPEMLTLVEGLSDAQLSWQPHPLATSIGFNVWHVARWVDYVQARLPHTTAELGRRLEPRLQLWQLEALAAKWGLDPTTLGAVEAGN